MSWLSKQLEKSKKSGTGIYSWGDAIEGYKTDKGSLSFMGIDYSWGGEDGKSNIDVDLGGKDPETEYLKYGFIALGAWVIIKLAGR